MTWEHVYATYDQHVVNSTLKPAYSCTRSSAIASRIINVSGDLGQGSIGVHGGDVQNGTALAADHVAGEHLGGQKHALNVEVKDEIEAAFIEIEEGGDIEALAKEVNEKYNFGWQFGNMF